MKPQYALDDRDFLRGLDFDPEECDREAVAAKMSGQTVLQGMLRSSRITWLDYLMLCLDKRNFVEIEQEDDFPEFDLLLEMEGVKDVPVFAIGIRGDSARRVIIAGPSDLHGSSFHESLHHFLRSKNYRVIGYMGDENNHRPAQMLASYRSRSRDQLALSGDGEKKVELHDLFDRIAQDAIKQDASDIHIAMKEGKTGITFRINGSLIQQHAWAMTQDEGLAMVRSLYNLITAGTRHDYLQSSLHDGVIEREYERGRERFRFSSLPVEPAPGSDVTLRIIHIGATAKVRTATQLGYSEQHQEQLGRMFARSSGLILFNGITGSGKSTSLSNFMMQYCRLHEDRKVRTVEDPVEYIIPGAWQTPAMGDFNNVLKQLLRSDPDVLMVGEIRDHDTADLIINAVRTGHLSVSTLHADSALMAYDRLSGMGVSRHDLASVGLISGLVFQRLVKVTCSHCRVPAADIFGQPDMANKADLALANRLRAYLMHYDGNCDAVKSMYWHNPSGCERCHSTGYSTRTVCAEIFIPDDEMSPIIASGDSLALRKAWRASIDRSNPRSTVGRTAFEHALIKMRDGTCSPAAVEDQFDFIDEAIRLDPSPPAIIKASPVTVAARSV